MSLNIVIADAIRYGEPLQVNGKSSITILTPQGKILFKGVIRGTATYNDLGTLDTFTTNLKFIGSLSTQSSFMIDLQNTFMVLDMQGLLTRTVSPDGQIIDWRGTVNGIGMLYDPYPRTG
jgi:hypothetical protein